MIRNRSDDESHEIPTAYRSLITDHRSPIRRIQKQRHRPVVDKTHSHHRAEDAGFHGDSFGTQQFNKAVAERLSLFRPGGLGKARTPAFAGIAVKQSDTAAVMLTAAICAVIMMAAIVLALVRRPALPTPSAA